MGVIPRHAPRRFDRRRLGLAGLVALVLAVAAAVLAARFGPSEARHRDVAVKVEWATELRRVDDTRARAFAARDPALLAQVYVAGALRTSDANLLVRLVPTGCVLRGAATRFSHVSVRPAPDRAVVTARARIPAALLHCSGRPDRATAAVGPTTVRIVLVSTTAGVRIADLRTIAG